MLLAVRQDAPKPAHANWLTRMREQLALTAVFALLAIRYWLTVFPRTAAEIRRLRAHAAAIPHPEYRRLALAALSKRSNLEGAAAFAALVPRSARAEATRALVAFQSIYNYADTLAEQPSAECRQAAGRAHAALLLALCARANPPLTDDGRLQAPDRAYLLGQIESCRRALGALPSADRVIAPALLAATDIGSFQTYSSMDPGSFESWARSLPTAAGPMSWWESAGAAGSSLTVYALIAAAGARTLDRQTVERLIDAYGGPIGALHSLLDSLIDESEDADIGQASLIGCYPSRPAAAKAMGEIAARAMTAARALPDGRRHAVLVSAMASLYLQDPHARTPRAAPVTAAVREGIGSLATPTMAVFALRRLAAVRTTPRARERARRARAEPAEPERPAGVCARAG